MMLCGPAGDPERGQALVLEALVIGLVLIFLLPVSSLALVAAERAGTQTAADAAALACAGAADVWTVVDARGTVYAARVTVAARRGRDAAVRAWDANVRGWPLTTLGWSVAIGGAECRFRASVRAGVPLWRLLGRGTGPAWHLTAAARAVSPAAGAAGLTSRA